MAENQIINYFNKEIKNYSFNETEIQCLIKKSDNLLLTYEEMNTKQLSKIYDELDEIVESVQDKDLRLQAFKICSMTKDMINKLRKEQIDRKDLIKLKQLEKDISNNQLLISQKELNEGSYTDLRAGSVAIAVSGAAYYGINKMTNFTSIVHQSLNSTAGWFSDPLGNCVVKEIKTVVKSSWIPWAKDEIMLEYLDTRQDNLICNALNGFSDGVLKISNVASDFEDGIKLMLILCIFLVVFLALKVRKVNILGSGLEMKMDFDTEEEY